MAQITQEQHLHSNDMCTLSVGEKRYVPCIESLDLLHVIPKSTCLCPTTGNMLVFFGRFEGLCCFDMFLHRRRILL